MPPDFSDFRALVGMTPSEAVAVGSSLIASTSVTPS